MKSGIHFNKKHILYIVISVGALFVILLNGFVFFHNFRHLRDTNSFGRKHEPKDMGVESLRDWMTFDYVNKVYNMPPEYLKAELQITDNKYPAISIMKVAKGKGVDKGAFLNSVKSAVKMYLSANSASTK